MIALISLLMIPILILVALIMSCIKKTKPYDSFIRGSKEGISLFTEVFPSVLAMLFAVSMLKASGLLDDLSYLLGSLFKNANIVADITPMLIFRPISGSASLAVLSSVCTKGPDSLSCKIASTIQGSTDTTLYVLALYFSSVGITKWKHALSVGLFADAVGMFTGILLAVIFLG